MTRVALITAGAADSGVASARLAALLPHLEAAFDVALYGPPTAGALDRRADFGDRPIESCASLRARDFDQVLYFLANCPSHAFMVPLLHRLGGVVVLHDWNLGRLALAARPALARPGLAGQLAAWREGGLGALRMHRREGAGVAESLPLNRSVVRRADAFIVPSQEWRGQILAERNAPTPVAVVPWEPGRQASGLEDCAERFRECLRVFPAHRTNRKSLIRTAIEESDRARADRDRAW